MAKTPQTVEQKIAEKEAELARLREKKKRQEAGQKIVLGGMLLAAAREDSRYKEIMLEIAEKYVTRKVDRDRIQPLLDEFKEDEPEYEPDIMEAFER